ncbi:MAG: alpha-glucosidase C-terminal domain-containing protein, partial [Treponema sp.]|nr:alpha-glucosidase C-terminal domain-containing protein [Treponema sp.]
AVPQIDGGSLENAIRDFARIKKENAPLQYGNYKQLVVKNMQFAFMRCADGEEIIVAFNCENVSAQMRIEGISCAAWKDLISGEEFSSEDMKHLEIKEYGFRILRKM